MIFYAYKVLSLDLYSSSATGSSMRVDYSKGWAVAPVPKSGLLVFAHLDAASKFCPGDCTIWQCACFGRVRLPARRLMVGCCEFAQARQLWGDDDWWLYLNYDDLCTWPDDTLAYQAVRILERVR